MSATESLERKLRDGSITAAESETLLGRRGWTLERMRGSHQVWAKRGLTFIWTRHGKDLKRYQLRQAQRMIQAGDSHDGKT